MDKELELDDVSFVTSNDHWENDSWRYRYVTERIVSGKLSDDVRKKLNTSQYANVYITEEHWADGYSTWTHWDESEVTIRCQDFEKTFYPNYSETIVTQIMKWIESDD